MFVAAVKGMTAYVRLAINAVTVQLVKPSRMRADRIIYCIPIKRLNQHDSVRNLRKCPLLNP